MPKKRTRDLPAPVAFVQFVLIRAAFALLARRMSERRRSPHT